MSHKQQNVNNQNVGVDQSRIASHQHLHYVPSTMVGGSISQPQYNCKKPIPRYIVAGFKNIHTHTHSPYYIPALNMEAYSNIADYRISSNFSSGQGSEKKCQIGSRLTSQLNLANKQKKTTNEQKSSDAILLEKWPPSVCKLLPLLAENPASVI